MEEETGRRPVSSSPFERLRPPVPKAAGSPFHRRATALQASRTSGDRVAARIAGEGEGLKGTHCGRRDIPLHAPIDIAAGARTRSVPTTTGATAPRPPRLRDDEGAGIQVPAPVFFRHLAERLVRRLGAARKP